MRFRRRRTDRHPTHPRPGGGRPPRHRHPPWGRCPDGADLMRGDAGDRDLLRRAVTGGSGSGPAAEPVAGVFHCIHTSHDARAWATDLPDREQAVMDVAAEAGVPVVFPESVYAFGTVAQDLDDGTVEGAVRGDVEPASPLGEIRVNLLAVCAAHPARTLSVVAADLIGPTADPASSAFHLLKVGSRRGGAAGVDARRPRCATVGHLDPRPHRGDGCRGGACGRTGSRGHRRPPFAPTALTMTPAADGRGGRLDGRARVSHIPWWILRVAGVFSPMMRELRRQRYSCGRPGSPAPRAPGGKVRTAAHPAEGCPHPFPLVTQLGQAPPTLLTSWMPCPPPARSSPRIRVFREPLPRRPTRLRRPHRLRRPRRRSR